MPREIMAVFFSENIPHIADSTVQNNINFHKLLYVSEWVKNIFEWAIFECIYLRGSNFFACIKNFARVNFILFCVGPKYFALVDSFLFGAKIYCVGLRFYPLK